MASSDGIDRRQGAVLVLIALGSVWLSYSVYDDYVAQGMRDTYVAILGVSIALFLVFAGLGVAGLYSLRSD